MASTDYKTENDIVHDEGGLKVDHVEDNEAAGYVDPTIIITDEINKHLRKRVFRNLLPIMCIAYITQSLDKGTLTSASIMGWQASVGAVGQDYALASTFLYIGIIVGEPVVNQLIRKLPVAKILGFSMVIWTILLVGLTFSLSIGPVWAIRFLLGFFESSFNPCLVAITVQWFTKEEQTMITTIWQCMFAVANFVAALLAWGFYQITGAGSTRSHGLYTWQWMTLCITFMSAFATVLVIIFLPDSPTKARWPTREEKTLYIERVRQNDQGIKQKSWKNEQALEILSDPLPWLAFTLMFVQTLVVGGLNTFNNLLITKAFGFSVSDAQLLGMPLAAFQVLLYFLVGYIGTKWKQTALVLIGCTFVNIAGSVVLITVEPTSSSRVGLLVTSYLMQSFPVQATSPSIYAMMSRNIAGQTKKSIVYAMFFIGWAGGNAIGPQFFAAVWAPRYRNSLYIHLGLYAVFNTTCIAFRIISIKRNTKRETALQGEQNQHTQAFDDLTDRQNVDFRYSY